MDDFKLSVAVDNLPSLRSKIQADTVNSRMSEIITKGAELEEIDGLGSSWDANICEKLEFLPVPAKKLT